MKYHFRIHKEKPKGYWAECIELEGCVTSGDTLKELRISMREALNTYLDEIDENAYLAPLPSNDIAGKSIEQVPVDPQIAFALLLRHERHRKKLTQKQMAVILNKKNAWSYQRLEKSSSNPTLATVVMIKEAFPKFPSHLIFE